MIGEDKQDSRPTWCKAATISAERITALLARLQVPVDIQQGVYPFANVELTRADVEWLLLNHDKGRGPVNWSDPLQRERKGLDLRGARLAGEDLSDLPLAGLRGGLDTEERIIAFKHTRDKELRDAAAIHLEGANLARAHLEGAILRSAHLEGACLFRSQLQEANLAVAHMEGSDCRAARFEGAGMTGIHLEGFSTDRPPTPMRWIADFSGPVVELHQVEFQRNLPAASLRLAYFDASTSFSPNSIGNKQTGFIAIADARLKEMNLTRVDWTTVSMLGDERLARGDYNPWGKPRTLEGRISVFDRAARAYSQLALALAAQGMANQATNFQYRALILQRSAMWLRIRARRLGLIIPYLMSWMLFVLTGYGYRMRRLLGTYVVLNIGFAVGYALAGHYCSVGSPTANGGVLNCHPGVSWFNLVLTSVTAFHGRVFSQQFVLGSPQSVLTACEAIVGLVVEALFIAMLTQRVFSR